MLNSHQVERKSVLREAYESQHHLEQGTEYEDFYKPDEPFSQSDDYLKFNSFIVGLKLADTYQYTDDCINDIINSIDYSIYFGNNVTQHDKKMKDGSASTWGLPYLNVTGLVYGPVADALPNCFNFLTSVYTVENARFLTFNQNWGNFFLAFLFNQMGNALNFQTKFERIQVEEERQNYPGVWQEYGDLVYLIWTFQPIESASLQSIEDMAMKWYNEHEWMLDTFGLNNDVSKAIVQTGVSSLGQVVHGIGQEFGIAL